MAATAVDNARFGLNPADAYGIDHTGGLEWVRDALTAQPRPLAFGRPAWRGRMHAWAFAAALPGGLLLATAAAQPIERAAASIYALTLALVFGTSAAYHRMTRTERSRLIMRKLDHSMIYLLIAGTYAPMCLVALPHRWGVPILAYVSLVATIGIVTTLVAFNRARRFAYALYPIMVGTVILASPLFVTHLTGTQLALVVAGVGAYAAGVPVLMKKRPDPWPTVFGYHEIWHVSTIVAASLHFAAIHDILAG